METRSQGRRLVVAGIGTLLSGALLLPLWLLRPPSVPEFPEPVSTEPPTTLTNPGEDRPAAPRAPLPPPAPLQPVDPVGKMLGELATSEDYRGSIEQLRQDILKKDERLALAAYYHEHVLPDSVMRADYRKLLADTSMLGHIRQGLLFPSETRESLRGNLQRLLQIDYLRDALSWGDNPQREAVLGALEELILTDNFRDGQDTAMRYSLAGNKLELYELLHAQDPRRAEALVSRARGSRLEKLLEYFAARTARLQARERELSLASKQ